MKPADKNLHRITLTLTLNAEKDGKGDWAPAPLKLSFIYGVGSAGLTPFEVFLADMDNGEAKEIVLAARDIPSFLGCLFGRLQQHSKLPATAKSLRLIAVLDGCEPAEPREIVQSMARTVGEGGCGGSCGCGCG